MENEVFNKCLWKIKDLEGHVKELNDDIKITQSVTGNFMCITDDSIARLNAKVDKLNKRTFLLGAVAIILGLCKINVTVTGNKKNTEKKDNKTEE